MSKGPSALTERDHNANFVSPRSAAAVTLSSFSRCLLSQPCPAGTHRSVPCDGLTQEGPNAATTMGRSHYSGGSSLVDHDVPAASDRAPWPLPDAGVIRAQNPRVSSPCRCGAHTDDARVPTDSLTDCTIPIGVSGVPTPPSCEHYHDGENQQVDPSSGSFPRDADPQQETTVRHGPRHAHDIQWRDA